MVFEVIVLKLLLAILHATCGTMPRDYMVELERQVDFYVKNRR